MGQVIQLERRGFFRCDEAFGDIHNTHSEAAITLFYIPDGKMKAPAAAPGPSGK